LVESSSWKKEVRITITSIFIYSNDAELRARIAKQASNNFGLDSNFCAEGLCYLEKMHTSFKCGKLTMKNHLVLHDTDFIAAIVLAVVVYQIQNGNCK
jgi:hypothetical protein